MNLQRISTVLDLGQIDKATVAIVGAGGSAGLACDLARCGVRRFKAVDPQRLEARNLARQGHTARYVGMPKVDALAGMIGQINPEAEVDCLPVDFTKLTEAEINANFGDVSLFFFGTDSFKAQAFGNQVALRLGIPAIWVGLYRGGQAGEVIFWHRDLPACFRCLCAARYRAQERAASQGIRLDPTSDGADIFPIHILDSIAGMIALGLLTRGANNRYGRLIDQFGDRNFVQVKIDPTWQLRGHDVVRDQLGIAPTCDTYFAWNTIVRRDPDGGQPPCPDCVKYLSRQPKPGLEAIPDATW